LKKKVILCYLLLNSISVFVRQGTLNIPVASLCLNYWHVKSILHLPFIAFWLICYYVTNKCTHFIWITIMFQYANSYMFWASLAHHQGVQICLKPNIQLY